MGKWNIGSLLDSVATTIFDARRYSMVMSRSSSESDW